MTIDYHRTPMIQFRPDAELYAAIEAHQRPGESINQTAKRLLIESGAIARGLNARLSCPPRADPVPVGHGRNTRRADSG